MDSNSKLQLPSWNMPNLESSHCWQQIKGHVTDLPCVPDTILVWQSWSNHIGIANCLDLYLNDKNTRLSYFYSQSSITYMISRSQKDSGRVAQADIQVICFLVNKERERHFPQRLGRYDLSFKSNACYFCFNKRVPLAPTCQKNCLHAG